MPFAFAADAAFFKEVVSSERRASRRAATATAQRQLGGVASTKGQVHLTTAFPVAACRPPAAGRVT